MKTEHVYDSDRPKLWGKKQKEEAIRRAEEVEVNFQNISRTSAAEALSKLQRNEWKKRSVNEKKVVMFTRFLRKTERTQLILDYYQNTLNSKCWISEKRFLPEKSDGMKKGFVIKEIGKLDDLGSDEENLE